MTDESPPWVVYILRCSDGSLYTGITNNLARRVARHNSGTAARYTRPRRPVVVVHVEAQASQGDALRREAAIKRLKRAQKQALVGTDVQNSGRIRA